MDNPQIIDLGTIAYADALALQLRYFEEAIVAKQTGNTVVNRILLCEHLPVFTLGKHGERTNLFLSRESLAAHRIDYFETDRGGDVTFHGPGQLVVYPILDLELYGIGLRQYVCALESAVIHLLSHLSICGECDPQATGVWIDPGKPTARKICAIGIRSSRYVTMHGIALNVSTDLDYFRLMNPCGIADRGVTSIARETNSQPSIDAIKLDFTNCFLEILSKQ